MDSDRKSIAEQILEAINYGDISESEVERRLDKILDEELSVPIHTKVNMTKVNLCNSLLWQLYTHGRIAYEKHMEYSKKVVEKHYLKHRRRKRVLYGGLRTIVLSLVIFVLLTTFESARWVNKSSTEDGQQLIVSYHEVNGISVAKAIKEHDVFDELTSDSSNEVNSFLGFNYDFPAKVGASYYPSNYHVLVMPDFLSIMCIYKSENKEREAIALQTELFVNSEGAMIRYEQDAEGEKLIMGGETVYRYNNAGKIRYIWEKSNQVFKLSINGGFELSDQEILDIVKWGCNQ